MAVFTRTETDLLGSFASPTAIAAAGSSTTTAVDLTGTNTASGCLTVTLVIGGTAPTTAPTVQFQESLDGTNFETVVTYVCPNVAGARYPYPYPPTDPSCKKVRAVVTNGATTGIAAYAQGNTLAVT